MSAPRWPRYVPIADHALLVSFGDTVADVTSAAVLGLDRALAKSPPEGLLECIPALVSLLIEFDPLVTDRPAQLHRNSLPRQLGVGRDP